MNGWPKVHEVRLSELERQCLLELIERLLARAQENNHDSQKIESARLRDIFAKLKALEPKEIDPSRRAEDREID